jgi:hypothetical protein
VLNSAKDFVSVRPIQTIAAGAEERVWCNNPRNRRRQAGHDISGNTVDEKSVADQETLGKEEDAGSGR